MRLWFPIITFLFPIFSAQLEWKPWFDSFVMVTILPKVARKINSHIFHFISFLLHVVNFLSKKFLADQPEHFCHLFVTQLVSSLTCHLITCPGQKWNGLSCFHLFWVAVFEFPYKGNSSLTFEFPYKGNSNLMFDFPYKGNYIFYFWIVRFFNVRFSIYISQ